MVTCLQVTPSAREVLFSASRDGTVRVWSIASARPISVIRSEHGPIYCILAVANGRSVLSGGSDGSVSRFDRESGRLQRVYRGPSTIVFGLGATDEGGLVAVGKDRALHHWSCSEPCEFCVACRGSGSCARHETMECPHEGCSQSFRSKALFDAHVAICEHFRRPCPNVCSGCPMRAMPKGEYEAHSRVCGFRLINCPNASCEVRLLASDLAHHRATTCLYEEVRCPNKGCNSMLERGELDRHSQQT
eukprot:g5004.t1